MSILVANAIDVVRPFARHCRWYCDLPRMAGMGPRTTASVGGRLSVFSTLAALTIL